MQVESEEAAYTNNGSGWGKLNEPCRMATRVLQHGYITAILRLQYGLIVTKATRTKAIRKKK